MSELEDKINNLLSSPDEMEKIAKLAQSLMGGIVSGSSDNEGEKDGNPLEGLLGGIDPNMIASIGKAMSDGSQDDKTKLLSALAPFLAEKRRVKMTKAINIARMAKLAGVVFTDNGGGGLGGV